MYFNCFTFPKWGHDLGTDSGNHNLGQIIDIHRMIFDYEVYEIVCIFKKKVPTLKSPYIKVPTLESPYVKVPTWSPEGTKSAYLSLRGDSR